MKELLLIDLNDLEARLTIRRREFWDVFFIKLFNGRLEAIARKTVFDHSRGKALSEVIKTITLENFQTELGDWPPVAIWAVKGLWGVPLEYGETNVSIQIRSDWVQSNAKSERVGYATGVALRSGGAENPATGGD